VFDAHLLEIVDDFNERLLSEELLQAQDPLTLNLLPKDDGGETFKVVENSFTVIKVPLELLVTQLLS
jgi:hypothetical protein